MTTITGRMREVIARACDKHGLKVIQVRRGDRHCRSNGEANYLGRSYLAGNEVYLGIYDDAELKLISMFHEVGHKLLPKGFRQASRSTLLLELECWRLGVLEARRLGVVFSDKAVKWGYEQGLGYAGWDERERSDWKKNMAPTLWVNGGR